MAGRREQETDVPGTRIWEEVRQARVALNRYTNAIAEASRAGLDHPMESGRVRQERDALHVATMAAFTAVRPYLYQDISYWEDRILDDRAGIVGMEELERYQLNVDMHERIVEQRHGAETVKREWDLRRLTDTAYRNAIHAMGEKLREDGFAPQPQERDIVAEPLMPGGEWDDNGEEAE